jgi:hypothetical protein
MTVNLTDLLNGEDKVTIENIAKAIMYTKIQLDAGQLDNRYYTETEIDIALALKASLAGAAFTGQVKGITPIAAEDLTRKDYVDTSTILDNGFINGGFDFWDYATSQTSNGYGSDNRWVNQNVGTTKTHSKQTSGDTERALFNSKAYSRTVAASVAGAANYCAKTQRKEGVNSYANGKATISFWAKADASKNIAIELVQNFGTGGSPSSAVTAIGSQKIALTTTWQYFTITVDIPSIVGKTLGTDENDYLEFYFWFDAGSNFNVRTDTLGQQNGTFDIAEVRIDEGEIAKAFGVTDLDIEGNRCKRYYEVIDVNNHATLISGTYYSSIEFYGVLKYHKKRNAPAVTHAGATLFDILSAGVSRVSTAIAFNAPTAKSVRVNLTTASSTAGYGAWASFKAGGAIYISSEL